MCRDANIACYDIQDEFKEKLTSYGIEEKLTPTYLPDGYKFDSVEVIETPQKTIFNGTYSNTISKKIYIMVSEQYAVSNQKYEKDDNEVVIYTVGNVNHYIRSNYDTFSVVWTNNNFECSIVGALNITEMKKIINSIYKGQ